MNGPSPLNMRVSPYYVATGSGARAPDNSPAKVRRSRLPVQAYTKASRRRRARATPSHGLSAASAVARCALRSFT